MVCNSKSHWNGWFEGAPPIYGNPQILKSQAIQRPKVTEIHRCAQQSITEDIWGIWVIKTQTVKMSEICCPSLLQMFAANLHIYQEPPSTHKNDVLPNVVPSTLTILRGYLEGQTVLAVNWHRKCVVLVSGSRFTSWTTNTAGWVKGCCSCDLWTPEHKGTMPLSSTF